ncbi:MAG: hypothetical protein LH609_05265, partial [Rudanella sp.]|nr:hypothetical protein [Rudanella sp.]
MKTTFTLTDTTLSFAFLTPREIMFLKLTCSELTYLEIAHEMRSSPWPPRPGPCRAGTGTAE